MTEEIQETAAPERPIFQPKLSKEQRSEIAKAAAKRRWAKAKKEISKAAKAKTTVKAAKKNAGPREFSSALKTAEKRLSKAIEERAFHAAHYAIVSAEIPSLQRIILALRNPSGPTPGEAPAFSLEQIVGDQALPYQNPPRLQQVPAIPVPQAQHPANTIGRAQGGAVALELEEHESEDKFLESSSVAGGQWR